MNEPSKDWGKFLIATFIGLMAAGGGVKAWLSIYPGKDDDNVSINSALPIVEKSTKDSSLVAGAYYTLRIGNVTGETVRYEILSPNGWRPMEIGPQKGNSHFQQGIKIRIRAEEREWTPEYTVFSHKPNKDEAHTAPNSVFVRNSNGQIGLKSED